MSRYIEQSHKIENFEPGREIELTVKSHHADEAAWLIINGEEGKDEPPSYDIVVSEDVRSGDLGNDTNGVVSEVHEDCTGRKVVFEHIGHTTTLRIRLNDAATYRFAVFGR